MAPSIRRRAWTSFLAADRPSSLIESPNLSMIIRNRFVRAKDTNLLTPTEN